MLTACKKGGSQPHFATPEALGQPESEDGITPDRPLLPSVDPAHRGVLERSRQMAQPVAVSGKRVLVEEDDDVPPSLLHCPVPAARSRRLGDFSEAGERELADDVPGAVRRA